MADYPAPVATGIDPTQGLQTLSGMLGVQSKRLAIQQQQQALQGQAAQVQQEQQSARQRQGIAGIDWSKYDDGTGMVSTDKMLADKDLQARAGDQFLDVVKAGAAVRANQLQNKQSLVGLNNGLRDQFGSVVGALRTDPDVINDTPAGRTKVDAAISRFAQAGGPDAARVAQIYGPVTQHAPPGMLERGLQSIQLQAMDAGKQAGAQSPEYAGAGNRLVQTNPLAAGGAPTGNITTGIAPGRQPFTDSFGRVFNFNPQTGNYQPAESGNAGGGANSSGSTKTTGPGAAAPGDVEAIKNQTESNFQNVDSNRRAATLAPQQLDQINKALSLSHETSTGGDWTTKRAQLESNLSSIIPGLKSAQDDATKIQELDKFLARITADSSKVLGSSAATDAAREQISTQNAKIGYTPQAIQNVLTYAKAQTLAMQAKGDAQENWLKQQGNGITNQHQFETQWRQAYDPILFQLRAATPADRTKIVQNLPADEAANLAKQQQLLNQLGVK